MSVIKVFCYLTLILVSVTGEDPTTSARSYTVHGIKAITDQLLISKNWNSSDAAPNTVVRPIPINISDQTHNRINRGAKMPQHDNFNNRDASPFNYVKVAMENQNKINSPTFFANSNHKKPLYRSDYIRNDSKALESKIKIKFVRPQRYENQITRPKNHNDDFSSSRKPRYAMSKEEMVKLIQESVMKYMKELEFEGKLPIQTETTMPKTVVKTYYKYPMGKPPLKEYSSFSESHPMPAPSSHYSSESSYKGDEYNNIDLTIKGRARARPIDLSALDVGQTWNHGPTGEITKGSYMKSQKYIPHSPASHENNGKKPRYYSNWENFHDINPSEDHHMTKESFSLSEPINYQSEASSGNSVRVNYKPEDVEAAVRVMKHEYKGPVHIINGLPVINPYKVDMKKVKQMFSSPDLLSSEVHPSDTYNTMSSSNWLPMNSPSYSSDSYSSESDSSTIDLESYNKYAENQFDKDHDEDINPSYHQNMISKRPLKGTTLRIQHGPSYKRSRNNELEMDLRPPPYRPRN